MAATCGTSPASSDCRAGRKFTVAKPALVRSGAPPYVAGERQKEERTMELGLYTFADIGADPAGGQRIGPSERLRNLVEELWVLI